MCLDRGLQGQGSTRPSPTPLVATPWARTASTHSADHNTIKHDTEEHKTHFYRRCTACWLSRVKSRPCACDAVSLNLENDLYDKTSSPKTPPSPSNMCCPIKKKRPSELKTVVFPAVDHPSNKQSDHSIMHSRWQSHISIT